jgi:hypothetical protein
LAGETEVLGENLPQCHFVHHKPHMLPVGEPGPQRWVLLYLIMLLSTVAWRHIESGGIAPPLLTSVLDGGEWSTSRPGRFTSGERAFGTHCIGGWMGLGAGLDAMEKRTMSCSYCISKAGCSGSSLHVRYSKSSRESSTCFAGQRIDGIVLSGLTPHCSAQKGTTKTFVNS